MIRSLLVSFCVLAATACQADTVTLSCGTTYLSNPGFGTCLDSSGSVGDLKEISVSAGASDPVSFAFWSGTVTVDVTSADLGLLPPGFPPASVYLVPCVFVQGQKSGTDPSMWESATFGNVSIEAGWGHLFSCSSPTEIPITVGTPQTFDLNLSVSAEDGFNGAAAYSEAALDGFEVRSNFGLVSANMTVDVMPVPEPNFPSAVAFVFLTGLLLIRRQN